MRTTMRIFTAFACFVSVCSIYWCFNSYNTTSLSSYYGPVGGPIRSTELGQVRPIINSEKSDEKNVVLNDPGMSQNWGIANTKAAQAWHVSQGSRQIIVAVIDTGIDVNHPDLKNNLWTNAGEVGCCDKNGKRKENNGIDDDGNGFIDDIHGWNFVANNNDLTDNHGHGTHIAGIIGAEGGNGVGVSGIAPKVSLMVLKYFDPKARFINNLKATIEALKYAVKMNAHIINYSGGGPDYSQDEYQVITEARRKGILVVAAAGNERSDTQKIPFYPGSYHLDNIISVSAINKDQKILSSSNWGKKTVHIVAPGKDIFSTLPHDGYGFMTGTSQATAFVSGVATLILSRRPHFTALDVKNYILNTGDTIKDLRDKTVTSTQINTYNALVMLDSDRSVTGIRSTNTPVDINASPSENLAQFGKIIMQKTHQGDVNPQIPTIQ